MQTFLIRMHRLQMTSDPPPHPGLPGVNQELAAFSAEALDSKISRITLGVELSSGFSISSSGEQKLIQSHHC